MALAQYYMAKVAYLQKKYTDAEEYPTQAIENDPHLLDASLLLIDISLKQKKYDQARTALLHICQPMDNNRISKFIDEQLSVIGS